MTQNQSVALFFIVWGLYGAIDLADRFEICGILSFFLLLFGTYALIVVSSEQDEPPNQTD